MGGNSQQTSQTTNQPWEPAQPSLRNSISEGDALYNQQKGQGAVPWAAQTQQGMGQIANLANANSNGRGASGRWQDIINTGGYNAAQKNALDNTSAVANSQFNINDNPAFMDVLRQSQDAAANSVNQNASAAGRYGSGTNQQVLAQTVGDLTARMSNNEYQNFLSRKDAANNNMFQFGQTGIGNMDTAYAGAQSPAKSLMMLGGMEEDFASRQRNAPWALLGQKNAITSGVGSMGGTQTSSAPGQNPFLQGLGYASAGAGLLGML
jgi:hypothetical protein